MCEAFSAWKKRYSVPCAVKVSDLLVAALRAASNQADLGFVVFWALDLFYPEYCAILNYGMGLCALATECKILKPVLTGNARFQRLQN